MGIIWIPTHMWLCSNISDHTTLFTKNYLVLSPNDTDYKKVYSGRHDYIRNDSEYDKLILKPD